MLGQSQANASRQSKSIPNAGTAQPNTAVTAQALAPAPKSPSPLPKDVMQTTPGAFPDDDEEDDDDWIAPPPNAVDTTISRPQLPKSHTADVMEGIHDKNTVGQTDFARAQENGLLPSSNSAFTSSRQAPAGHGHAKSASVSTVPPMGMKAMYEEGPLLTKAATISNTALDSASVMESSGTPSKSQSRVFRDSPLKQVKNKLSSILKSSRGLLASSAAISAEGKSSMLSPSPSRLALHTFQSTDSILPKPSFDSPSIKATSKFGDRPVSPERAAGRRTRASIEKEKEDKRRDKEAKHLAEQMEKLEKAREQEREKARVFSKEQEKIAALEKQVASKKDHEKLLPRETPKPTRSSPRKAKMPEQPVPSSVSQDVEMADALPTSALPSAARPMGPAQATRNKEIRRPMRPGKEVAAKAKQAPTVIKVNTGSQHSQYHSSANPLPPAQESSVLPPPPVQQPQLSSKASKPTLQSKPSTQSLKSSTASMSRPKALDLAAKKKEQEEKEAQRRRDAKAEVDRKKAVAQEEQRRQEQQRRQDADRQKQKERDQPSQTEAKKSAQRQAAIEKAKQTRAPPPAVRSQPNGPPDFTLHPDKGASSQVPSRMDSSQSRPQSRMQSGMYRAPDDGNRPANAGTNNTAKASSKRTLPADGADDLQAKRPPSRGGSTYQAKDAKRRRTSENHQNDLDGSQPPNIKGPPVRPSGAFKKDLPKKSIFQNGYTNAPQSASRDLFKAAVTAQQPGQAKPAHPLDMAQISKGAIPFAPTANAAANTYKTPARPGPYNGAKSAAKSVPRTSPRFQNGESIELPEIQTDDEDEDDDEAQGMNIAAWADSPDLRRALMRQETMDPSQIFGPPKALNMEEVFSKNKDRWHKFRARTSSANWSGSDRLTEEDIRKDLAARDKLRREGAWSYEMSKELI